MKRRTFLYTTTTGISGFMIGCASTSAITLRNQFDLLIKNGAIIDGTGKAEILADIGIRDGIIKTIGKIDSTSADRIIDATGHKVVPGFVDIHTHTDSAILRLPTADSKLRQGVTTEVGGADGDSRAPRKKK
jgi:N-acyl-D-amino-acid deacylase